MKSWFESKTVWLGVLTTLLGALELASQYVENGAFGSAQGWMLFGAGVLGVVLRVWFTDVPVG